MNELKQIAEELKVIRKVSPRKSVPLELREKILSALKNSHLSREDATDLLGLHPMTFYKWQRKMAILAKKTSTSTHKKAVDDRRNHNRLIIHLLRFLDLFNFLHLYRVDMVI